MEKTEIEFNTLDALISVTNENLTNFSKAYFGNFYGNVMEAYLDQNKSMRNFTIVSLEEAKKGKPSITYSNEIEEIDFVSRSDKWGDAFQFDFDFFYNEDSIYIVNINNEKKPVNMICEDSRVEYGLNDFDIVYIKIKDLTKEEYEQMIHTLEEHDVLEKSNQREISEIMDDIEEKEDITIVQASTVGSRGWNYHTENSDLDLRFTYVRKPKDYIRIVKYPETITYPIEEGEDIVGYDLGKLLKMICNQNPFAYEIIHSNQQHISNSFSQRIIDFSNRILNPKKMIFTYQQFVEKELRELESDDNQSIKVTIYIIKALGIIDYLQREQKYPATDFSELFQNQPSIKKLLEELIQYKKEGAKYIEKNPMIIESLKQYQNYLKQRKIEEKEMPSSEEIEQEANDLLYEGIQLPTKKTELNNMLIEEKEEIEKRK